MKGFLKRNWPGLLCVGYGLYAAEHSTDIAILFLLVGLTWIGLDIFFPLDKFS